MAIIKPNNNTLSAITALPAAISTGKILQVVSTQVETSSVATSTSTTYVEPDTNYRVSITPSSASSKILVMASFPGEVDSSNESYYTIFRDSTDIGDAGGQGMFRNYGHDSHPNAVGVNLRIVDTPNTTSAITYSMKMKVGNSAATVYFNTGNVSSNILAMEIQG